MAAEKSKKRPTPALYHQAEYRNDIGSITQPLTPEKIKRLHEKVEGNLHPQEARLDAAPLIPASTAYGVFLSTSAEPL
jgi:hypothetical protein